MRRTEKHLSRNDSRRSFSGLCQKIKTTWGTITLTLGDSGQAVALNLPHLDKTPSKEFAILVGTARQVVRGAFGESTLPLNSTTDFFRWMEKEFRPVKIPDGTEFQRAVWREMKKIPRGETRTYGEIATAIGRPKAVRAVGSACGVNPLPVFIPCHRVIAKNGLGGFGYGLPWKKLLLKAEGWIEGSVN